MKKFKEEGLAEIAEAMVETESVSQDETLVTLLTHRSGRVHQIPKRFGFLVGADEIPKRFGFLVGDNEEVQVLDDEPTAYEETLANLYM